MTKKRVEGAQRGGGHGYEITKSRAMASPVDAFVQIRKKGPSSRGKQLCLMHSLGSVGWILVTPQVCVRGQDTPCCTTCVAMPGNPG